jgi:hypothetical protein
MQWCAVTVRERESRSLQCSGAQGGQGGSGQGYTGTAADACTLTAAVPDCRLPLLSPPPPPPAAATAITGIAKGHLGGDVLTPGYPARIWEKRTGVLNRSVAEHWREHFDLQVGPSPRWSLHWSPCNRHSLVRWRSPSICSTSCSETGTTLTGSSAASWRARSTSLWGR